MSVNVPYKSMLDVAKERMTQFKVKHNASMQELATVMGHGDKKLLQAFFKAKGSHYLSDNVIAEFGSQGLENAVAKFKRLRAPKASGLDEVRPQLAGDEKQGEPKAARVVDTFQKSKAPEATGLDIAMHETLQQMARRLHQHYRKAQVCKVSNADTVAMMNKKKPAFVARTFGAARLSVMFSPSGFKTMSDTFAEDVLIALAHCPWSTFPPELESWRGEEVKAHQPKHRGVGKNNVKPTPAAPRVFKPISEAVQKQQPKPKTSIKPPAPPSPAKTLESGANQSPTSNDLVAKELQQGVDKINTGQSRIEDVIDSLQANPQFRNMFAKKVSEMAELRIEQELSVSIAQLREVAPLVDVLIAAKRSNTKVKLVVG